MKLEEIFADLISCCARRGCLQCPMWRPEVKDITIHHQVPGMKYESNSRGTRNCMIANRPREWNLVEIGVALAEINRRRQVGI